MTTGNRRGFAQSAALALASRWFARSDEGAPAGAKIDREARPRAGQGAERAEKSDERAGKGGERAAGPSGRGADSPTEIPARGWKEIASRVWEEIGTDRVLAVAAGVTFYALLSVFPMIAALVSIYGLVADPSSIGEHLKTLSTVLPGGAVDIIGEQITRITSQPPGKLGFSFFIGLAVSLWSANAGVKAVFDALNVAYGETEKRSFIKLNAQSLLFTIGAIVSMLSALGALVILPLVLDWFGFPEGTKWLIQIALFAGLLVLLIFGLAVLYRYGPSRDQPQWRWLSPGAILAALVWVAASAAFSFYAANFGSYNETYGSLGAAIGFMTWIWISATIVLIGAELNAETEHQTAKDTTRGPPQPLGQRGARMADEVAAGSTEA